MVIHSSSMSTSALDCRTGVRPELVTGGVPRGRAVVCVVCILTNARKKSGSERVPDLPPCSLKGFAGLFGSVEGPEVSFLPDRAIPDPGTESSAVVVRVDASGESVDPPLVREVRPVLKGRRFAKVGDPVVILDPVDMVDFVGRPLTVDVEPDESVFEMAASFDGDLAVAPGLSMSGP